MLGMGGGRQTRTAEPPIFSLVEKDLEGDQCSPRDPSLSLLPGVWASQHMVRAAIWEIPPGLKLILSAALLSLPLSCPWWGVGECPRDQGSIGPQSPC